MKTLFVIVVSIISFTISAQEEQVKAPRIAVNIPLGEAVVIEGITITFAEVLEDSRCPTSVQCVWAGRARVKVLVSEEGKDPIEKVLIFGTVRPNESNNTTLCEKTDFVINGVQVAPYPEKPMEQLAYVLLVDKVAKN